MSFRYRGVPIRSWTPVRDGGKTRGSTPPDRSISMDIVDAQVHANMLGTETTLAIMDALGIAAVLFDEFDTFAEDGTLRPGYRLANGAFRSVGPNAEAAAIH